METLDHRDPEVFRVKLDFQGKQERGVVTELMEREECREKREPRAIEASTASPVFLERRDTEGKQVQQVLQDLQEMTALEVKMARLDRGVWLVRVVLEVCSAPEGLKVLQDSVVFLVLMDKLVPKEIWVLKESRGLLDSRACPVHMVLLVLKVQSGLLVKKDLKASRAWLAWLVLTALLVILVKRVPQEKRERRVILALWDPSVTLDHEE